MHWRQTFAVTKIFRYRDQPEVFMKVKKYQAYRISQVILHLGRNLKVQRSERNQMILRRLGIIKFRDEANGFFNQMALYALKENQDKPDGLWS